MFLFSKNDYLLWLKQNLLGVFLLNEKRLQHCNFAEASST